MEGAVGRASAGPILGVRDQRAPPPWGELSTSPSRTDQANEDLSNSQICEIDVDRPGSTATVTLGSVLRGTSLAPDMADAREPSSRGETPLI